MALPSSLDEMQAYTLLRPRPLAHRIGSSGDTRGGSGKRSADPSQGPAERRPRPHDGVARPLSPQRLFLAPHHPGAAPPPTRPPPRAPRAPSDPVPPHGAASVPQATPAVAPGTVPSSPPRRSGHFSLFHAPAQHRHQAQEAPADVAPGGAGSQWGVPHASPQRPGDPRETPPRTAAAVSPAPRGHPRSPSLKARIPGFGTSREAVLSSPSRAAPQGPALPFSPSMASRGSPSAAPRTAPLVATLSLDRQQGGGRGAALGTGMPAPLRLATQAPGSPWRSVGTPPRTPRQGADRRGASGVSSGPWERQGGAGAPLGRAFDSPQRHLEGQRHGGPLQQQQHQQQQGALCQMGPSESAGASGPSESEGASGPATSSQRSLPKGWPAGLFHGPGHFPPQVPHDYCSPFTSRHRPRRPPLNLTEGDGAGGASGDDEEASCNSARTLITQFGSELGSVRKPEAPPRQPSLARDAPSKATPAGTTPTKRHLVVRQLLADTGAEAPTGVAAGARGQVDGAAASTGVSHGHTQPVPALEGKASRAKGGRALLPADQGAQGSQAGLGGDAASSDPAATSDSPVGDPGTFQAPPAEAAAPLGGPRGVATSVVAQGSTAERPSKRHAGAHTATGPIQRAHSFSASQGRSPDAAATVASQGTRPPWGQGGAERAKDAGLRDGRSSTHGPGAGAQGAGGAGGSTPKKVAAGGRPLPWSPSPRSAPLSPRRASSLQPKGRHRGPPPQQHALRSPSRLSSPRLTESPDMNQKPGRDTHLHSPPQAQWDEHAEGLPQQGAAPGVARGAPAAWQERGQAAQGQSVNGSASPSPRAQAKGVEGVDPPGSSSGSGESSSTSRAALSAEPEAGAGVAQADSSTWAHRKWSRTAGGPHRDWEASDGGSDASSSDEDRDSEQVDTYANGAAGIAESAAGCDDQSMAESQGPEGVEGEGTVRTAHGVRQGAGAGDAGWAPAPSAAAAEDDASSSGTVRAAGSEGEPGQVQGLVFGIPVVDEGGPVIHPLSRSSAAFQLAQGVPVTGAPLPWAVSEGPGGAPGGPLSHGSLVCLLCSSSGAPLVALRDATLGGWHLKLAPSTLPTPAAPVGGAWGLHEETEAGGARLPEQSSVPEARLFQLCYLGERRVGFRSLAAEGRCLGATIPPPHGAATNSPWSVCHFSSWNFGESEAWRVLSSGHGAAPGQHEARSMGAWCPTGRGVLPGPLALRNEGHPECTLELAVSEVTARPSEMWRSLQRSAAQVPLLLRSIKVLSRDKGTPALPTLLAEPSDSGPGPAAEEGVRGDAHKESLLAAQPCPKMAAAGAGPVRPSPSHDLLPEQDQEATTGSRHSVGMGGRTLKETQEEVPGSSQQRGHRLPSAVAVADGDSVAGRVEDSPSETESVSAGMCNTAAAGTSTTSPMPKAQAVPVASPKSREDRRRKRGTTRGAASQPRAPGHREGATAPLAPQVGRLLGAEERGGPGQAEGALRRRAAKAGGPKVGALFRPPGAVATAPRTSGCEVRPHLGGGRAHVGASQEGSGDGNGSGERKAAPTGLSQAAPTRQSQAAQGTSATAGSTVVPRKRVSAAWRRSLVLSGTLAGAAEQDTVAVGERKARVWAASYDEGADGPQPSNPDLVTPERSAQRQRPGYAALRDGTNRAPAEGEPKGARLGARGGIGGPKVEGVERGEPASELKQRLSALRKRVAALKEQPLPEGRPRGPAVEAHTEGQVPEAPTGPVQPLPGQDRGHNSTLLPVPPPGPGPVQQTPTPAPQASGASDGPLMGSPEDSAPAASSGALPGLDSHARAGSPSSGGGVEPGSGAAGHKGASRSPLRRSLSSGAALVHQGAASPEAMAPAGLQDTIGEGDHSVPISRASLAALPRSLSQSRAQLPAGGDSPYAPIIMGLRTKQRALQVSRAAAGPATPRAEQTASFQAHLFVAGAGGADGAEAAPSPRRRGRPRCAGAREGPAAGALFPQVADEKENGVATVRVASATPVTRPAPKPAGPKQPSSSTFLRRHLQQLAGANAGPAAPETLRTGNDPHPPTQGKHKAAVNGGGAPQHRGKPPIPGPHARSHVGVPGPLNGTARAPAVESAAFARRPVTMPRRT